MAPLRETTAPRLCRLLGLDVGMGRKPTQVRSNKLLQNPPIDGRVLYHCLTKRTYAESISRRHSFVTAETKVATRSSSVEASSAVIVTIAP